MSDEARARPYVVLEEAEVIDLLRDALKSAEITLRSDDWERIDKLELGQTYSKVASVPSRNAAHALHQIGRRYDAGVTPPLVAVSERMFRPRKVNVAMTPSVSIV